MLKLGQFITFFILFSGCLEQMVNCQVLSSDYCVGQADIVFLVDASSSTTPTGFVSSLSYVYSMTQYLTIQADQTQVGVASIIGSGRADIYLSNFTDLGLFRSALLTVPKYTTDNSSGSLSASLDFVYQNMLVKNGGRSSVPKIIVIITTDVMVIKGNDASVVNVARTLKSNGVVILMVTYGRSQDPQAVHSKVGDIVSYPTENYTFSFNSPTFSGPSYNGSVTQLCKEIPVCAGVADIAFLLDGSGTIMPWDWDSEVSFVSSAVENMYIAQDGVRVAVLGFNQVQTLYFCFDRFTQRYDVIDEISTSVTFDEGVGKNTAGALKYTNQYIFNATCGSRPNVPHIVVVMSDGRSNLQPQLTNVYATIMKHHGIYIYAIGVGEISPDGEEKLKDIASQPAENYYININNFRNLAFLEHTLVMSTCQTPPAS